MYNMVFEMRDIVYLDRLEQAETLLKPSRLDILRALAEPHSCTEVGTALGQTPQKVYYHVKRLEAAGLVEQVAERRVRGINEGVYQAAGRSYWLSPRLVGALGPRPTDRLSLGYLLDLVEQVQAEVATLAGQPQAGRPAGQPDAGHPAGRSELPSLGISGEVRLPAEQRAAFLRELRTTLADLLTRYGGAEGETFRLAVACYPTPPEDPQ
jgi:DNA-binding transcriptional ArsR family regulator